MTINLKIMGLIGLCSRARKIVFGTDACVEQIIKNSIKLVVVAKDASERTIRKIKEICEENKIPFYNILSIQEISKAIGKENKAVIGVKDKNIADEIIKIINGGEIIG